MMMVYTVWFTSNVETTQIQLVFLKFWCFFWLLFENLLDLKVRHIWFVFSKPRTTYSPSCRDIIDSFFLMAFIVFFFEIAFCY